MGSCNSCSPPPGHKPKSIPELTRLAPLVLYAKVVAINNRMMNSFHYNATLNVTHCQVYKGQLNLYQIEVAGFGYEGDCGSEVFVNDSKIFFLNANPLRIRNDDLYSAVKTNSCEVLQGIYVGICFPYTSGWFIHRPIFVWIY